MLSLIRKPTLYPLSYSPVTSHDTTAVNGLTIGRSALEAIARGEHPADGELGISHSIPSSFYAWGLKTLQHVTS